MSVHYDTEKGAWRFAFNRKIKGKHIRATKLLPKGWTREEAEKYNITQTQELYQQYTTGVCSRPKIEDAVLVYLQEHCKELKTYDEYIREYKFLLPLYENKLIEELPEVCSAITALKAYTGHKYKKEHDLSAASKRKKIRMLCAACNWAYKYKRMGDFKPSERVVIPKVKNARNMYLSRAEVVHIARSIPARDARAVVLLAFYSGMRFSEVHTAQAHDGLFKLYDTKNNEVRFVPINPKVAVYTKRMPAPCHYGKVKYWWIKTKAELGYEKFRLHDLRHSTASAMINSGVDLYTVGAVLGHKSTKSTKGYAHLVTDTLKAALMKVR